MSVRLNSVVVMKTGVPSINKLVKVSDQLAAKRKIPGIVIGIGIISISRYFNMIKIM